MNREQRRAEAKKIKLPKTPEQERHENHNNMMNLIVGETFARHVGLDEKEYKKRIGMEKSTKDEDQCVRIAMFNVITETAKEIFSIQGKFNMANKILRQHLLGEEKENGK